MKMTRHIDPKTIYKYDPEKFHLDPEVLKACEKLPFLASLHILLGYFTLEEWEEWNKAQKDC